VERDDLKAFNLMKQAADLDYDDCMFCVGSYYHDGVGVERDYKLAFDW
jgi:TPR repeat protein